MQNLSPRAALVCVGIIVVLARPAAAEGAAEGAAAIMAGDYARAVTVLDPQVSKDPQDLEARGLLAMALYLNGQPLSAQRHAVVLRRLDPEGRQTAYLVSRHFLPSIRQESPVVTPLVNLLARSGSDGFLWLGQTYQDRKLYGDAVTILLRGASRYPRAVHLLDGLAFNEWKAGLDEPAIKTYLHAINLDPRSWSLYYNLGWVYYTSKMYADAAAAWKSALHLVPSNPMLPKLIQDAEQRTHS
jgi:tetratricopeptide (TPR) repeat protein